MIYRLSSTQQKELLLGARPLNIAIPAPIAEPANLLQWARFAFVTNDVGKYIVGVHRQTITVMPGTSDHSLAGVLGRIVQKPDECECPLMWRIEVVICRFHPPTPARLVESSIQWPKQAIHDGKRWPTAVATPRTAVPTDIGLNEYTRQLVDGE